MRVFAVISVLCFSAIHCSGQEFSLNRLPLNEPITVNILGSDKEYLHCYNLYGFEWKSPDDSVTGEFIVLKSEDTLQQSGIVKLKLCRVKEFCIMRAGRPVHIPVETGLQLEYPGQQERIFLNFDPAGPDPVFIPCK
jgi:hypothetical protein